MKHITYKWVKAGTLKLHYSEIPRMAEKYTLNWNTFSDHLQLMFKDLYEEDKYFDVTLVSDDHTQLKAHKIVLSACSPVFKKDVLILFIKV